MIKSWQSLEDEIQQFLVARQRIGKTMFHRFYDTRSAGNFMPGQPADFLVINNSKTYFIEAKFSEVHESLKSCFSGAVSGNQTASAHMADRAGATYVFLFYSQKADLFELWDGEYCFQQRSKGQRLHLGARRVFKTLENTILGGVFSGAGSSVF
jgi:hypothetical protein